MNKMRKETIKTVINRYISSKYILINNGGVYILIYNNNITNNVYIRLISIIIYLPKLIIIVKIFLLSSI